MLLEKEKRELIDGVAGDFENLCKRKLDGRLAAFYVTGSYAFGKISLDHPDINTVLIFKETGKKEDYLKLQDIFETIINEFKEDVLVRPEFRPFRYVHPKFEREYTITINPSLMNMAEKDLSPPFNYPKYFLAGIKSSRKLLHGRDVLGEVEIGKITPKDVKRGGLQDLAFWELPLIRAPVQYGEDEYELFFDEVFTRVKAMLYLGLDAALTEEELADGKFSYYAKNKKEMIPFFKERYNKEVSGMVEEILEARKNFLEYKKDRDRVEKMFGIALDFAEAVRGKLLEI